MQSGSDASEGGDEGRGKRKGGGNKKKGQSTCKHRLGKDAELRGEDGYPTTLQGFCVLCGVKVKECPWCRVLLNFQGSGNQTRNFLRNGHETERVQHPKTCKARRAAEAPRGGVSWVKLGGTSGAEEAKWEDDAYKPESKI